jgi:hypothetical protein
MRTAGWILDIGEFYNSILVEISQQQQTLHVKNYM